MESTTTTRRQWKRCKCDSFWPPHLQPRGPKCSFTAAKTVIKLLPSRQLKNTEYVMENRGLMQVKGKGEMDTWFLRGKPGQMLQYPEPGKKSEMWGNARCSNTLNQVKSNQRCEASQARCSNTLNQVKSTNRGETPCLAQNLKTFQTRADAPIPWNR